MKNLSILFIALLLLQLISFAQAPDTLWTKTFGGGDTDEGFSIQQTIDGGYIITGNTGSFGAGSRDVYLIKTDLSGDTLWTKTFGGSNGDYGYSVQQTIDLGYIITGSTGSYGAGSNDAYLIKTDSLGETLWTRTFGGTEPDVGYCVQQTSDDGYIITGAKDTQEGHGKIWLIKTNAFGDTIWTKTYGDNGKGLSGLQTSDGGYIFTGVTNVFGLGVGDIFLIKTDSSGDTLWTKTYYEWAGDYDAGYCVQQTSDNGYIIVGPYLIKTDSSGDTLWTKTYYEWAGDFDTGYCIQQTTDEGYIITGEEDDNLILIKTNSSGDTLWTKTLGGSNWDTGKSVNQTTDGGYIIAGTTSSFADTLGDIWLIKVEPDSPSVIENFEELIPSNYSISQNFPNPFNPTTKINYQIPELSFVTIKVYDVLGNEITTLVNEEKPVGNYEFEFNASELSSGIYFYRLQVYPATGGAGDFFETKKMILMK